MNTVLGIETSCDETSVALYSAEKGLLNQQIYSHLSHRKHGGVVPELAAREHTVKLLPLLERSLSEAAIDLDAVDGFAYTRGPGLPGALLTGAAFTQSLAWSLQKPAIGIHHLEGHLLSPFVDSEHAVGYPFACLLISGGHTLFTIVHQHRQYEVVGESVDDAAGEAFDKTARLLGLGYPGGAALERLAAAGDDQFFAFPRPMTNRKTLNMSFSGLKTHVKNLWLREQNSAPSEQIKANIAAGFQRAVSETIALKLDYLLDVYCCQQVVCAGGVAANQLLRRQLAAVCRRHGRSIIFPPLELCTDNAAMIAYAGYLRLRQGEREDHQFDVKPNWPLAQVE